MPQALIHRVNNVLTNIYLRTTDICEPGGIVYIEYGRL